MNVAVVKLRTLIATHQAECVRCHSKKNLRIDHIYPVSRGGKTEEGNLQVLCEICNGLKGNSIPIGMKDSIWKDRPEI